MSEVRKRVFTLGAGRDISGVAAISLVFGHTYLIAEDGSLTNAAGHEIAVVVEGLPQRHTRVERILALQDELEELRALHAGDPTLARQSGVGRELSLAITALEDARSRYTAAMARAMGKFRPADLERFSSEDERAAFYGPGSNEAPA